MALRKANIATTTLANNAGSFVNQTNDRLHIRKIVGRIITPTAVIGDDVSTSLDEIPVTQENVDDSRSHIAAAHSACIGGTGAVTGTTGLIVLSFNRDDLVLDPDEALFVNNRDIGGTPSIVVSWNLWYQD